MVALIERRSIEEIEASYPDVELSNDGLLNYHGGQGSAIYSVGSRWMGHAQVDNDDETVKRAVEEMDSYIEWATPRVGTDPEINLDEALAYRAMLAAHWNTQFDDGGERDDGFGPIEVR